MRCRALNVCQSVPIVRYIVIDRATSDSLTDCYILAVRNRNTEMIDFIEGLDNEDIIKTLVDETVADMITTMSETDAADSADRVISLSARRLGTADLTEEEKTVVTRFVDARAALRDLIKAKLPDSYRKYEEEANEAAEDEEEGLISLANDLGRVR